MTNLVTNMDATGPDMILSQEAFLCLDGVFRSGDKLEAVNVNEIAAAVLPFDLDPKPEKHTVYNFEVEVTHTYIAGGYRVHNTSALAFFDPDENGFITNVDVDENGNIFWESLTPDGGKWKTVSIAEGANGDTTRVEKEYTLGAFNADGTPVINPQTGEPVTRFYLQQDSIYEKDAEGNDVLKDIVINENYWLYGDEVGGDVAAAATPFILEAIGAESTFERLAAGTLIDAVIQNIAEGGLNALHHSILYVPTNGEAVNTMITDAWSDFGIDLAVSGIDTGVSLVSEFIMAEIFSSLDIDTLPEEFMVAVAQEGINFVLETGVDNFLDNILGADSPIAEAYDPQTFDFSSVQAYAGLALNLAIDKILPPFETTEGAFASAIAKVFAGSLQLAWLPGLIVTQVIGFVVGKIVDALFDKDPQAFANLSFDENLDVWQINSIFSDDGGNVALARSLGESVISQFQEFADLMQSTDIEIAAGTTLRIGHYEEHWRNHTGANYAANDLNVIFASVMHAVRNMSATDGDLKVLRALSLDTLDADTVGLTSEQAYSMVYTRLRMAADYQYYLNNTEFVNSLILSAPDSDLAKSWLATVLAAEQANLNGSYTYAGNETDNLILTGDGGDNISGGGGNDEIRTYGEDDIIDGGAGDDTISGGAGADAIGGGEDIDTITFDDSGVSVALDLSLGIGTVGDAEGDTYQNVENIIGSNFADTIVGSIENNTIQGLKGQDILSGHAGDDFIEGNEGNDHLFGDLGADTSLAGIDTLLGGVGDDTLHGGEGLDSLDGGAGLDAVSYRHSLNGVRVDVGLGETRVGGQVEYFSNIEGAIGSKFSDHLIGTSGRNLLQGLEGDDRIDGGAGSDTYIYTLGDGTDRIYDNDSNTGNVDTLILRGVAAADVEFHIDRSNDLVVRFADNASIFVSGQFTEDQRNGLEAVEFELTGETLDLAGIRNRAVADQKSTGEVIGSDHREVYYHAEGDGSYSITDWDDNARTDRLVFLDHEAGQVSFASNRNEDLVLTTVGGDTITVVDHFAEHQDKSIEEIEFSDGTVLTLADIRNRSVADQAETGIAIGSDLSETYTHALGDGSYVINDWDDNARLDRLEFTNTTADQATFDHTQGGHLKITLLNGDVITIESHFAESGHVSIEQIAFGDGAVLDASAIRAKTTADQKSSGRVDGTHHEDLYLHAQGDGSYVIFDSDDNARVDRLHLTNVMQGQVQFAVNESRDLTITFQNGEVITIAGQFNETNHQSIEIIQFSDGSELSLAAIRAKATADQASSGHIVGTDFADSHTHTAGDGSFSLLDRDDNQRLDSLTFAGIASTAVSFVHDGDSLKIDLGNGEVATITGQFASTYYGVEEFRFSDGVVVARSEVSGLLQTSAAGTNQTGTDADETYTHTRGDGSYAITDYDYWVGADKLVFADSLPESVSVGRAGNDIQLTLDNGEVVTLARQLDTDRRHGVESIEFSDGTIWAERQLRDQLVNESSSNGLARGTENDETYSHARGDGSYLISDYDYWTGADRLVLTDALPEDVVLSRSGNDLEISFDDGETITLVRQLDTDRRYGVESVEFADGSVWSERKMRDQLVEDQKAIGKAVGTENDETYVHTSGDGSWAVSDYDYWTGGDRLTFTDVASTEVTFSRLANDVVVTLANGETVTIDRQIQTDNRMGVETIEFSDGVSLDRGAIRNRLVEDMKETGVVLGSENDETYIHTVGDGSYSIRDYDYWTGGDRLILSDMLQSDVMLAKVSADIVLLLSSGESITLEQQLNTDNRMGVETIQFADGSTWNRTDIRNQLVADQKVSGIVRGTEQDEVYRHTQGDGSYRITDYDYWIGNDRLVLTDTLESEVSVARQGRNVELTLPNGDTITIIGQLDEDQRHQIEVIEFADGSTWTPRQLRNLMVEQMQDDGVVWGTDQNETYVHTLGEGSYTVEDYDYWKGADHFVATDATPDDVIVSRYGNDAIFTFSNGDTVTLLRQLDENLRYSIETFEFADGTVWSERAMRDRMVSDAKATGTVVGTENDETYYHAAGDGSYTVTDYDYWKGFDHLIFQGLTPDDVTFGRIGNDMTLSVAGGDEIRVIRQLDENLRYSFEQISFADGTILGAKGMRDKMVADMKPTGVVVGTENNESYFHFQGDGSYTLTDYDYWQGDDRFAFSDLNFDQVTFSRVGNDLVMTTVGMEEIRVVRQFDENLRHSLEQIQFADGVVLGPKAIRDRMVSDAKATGVVVGTENNETYYHTAGDGSYTLTDYDYWKGDDRFIFSDLNADQVTFSRIGNDLVMTTVGMEVIRVVRQLDENLRHSLEQIQFADGTVLGSKAIRDRMVADSKATGVVVGTENDETYYHTIGDGSYSILDYDYWRGNDRLVFTDATPGQVILSRDGNDLLLTAGGVDTIRLDDQMTSDGRRSIETFEFSDGTVWNKTQLGAKLVGDMKASGLVVGTAANETVVHTLGEGSYTIDDVAAGSTGDRLEFANQLATDISFSRIGVDAILTLSNGEVITLKNQFEASLASAIETIEFSNGTEWGQKALRNAIVAEQKAAGTVTGTGFAETYYHTSGDGSYSIDSEADFAAPVDELVFTDLLRTDVVAEAIDGNAVLTTSGGEVITVVGQYAQSSDWNLKLIRFADGEVVNQVNDLEPILEVGVDKYGTEGQDRYIHYVGNGTYSIFDFDPGSNSANDRLTFVDLTIDDVTFAHGSNNTLIMRTIADESISVPKHFEKDGDEAIEEIVFSDGVTLGWQGIRDKTVADMKSTGTVQGTEWAENYVHNQGDGSYIITEADWGSNSATDTFTFTDVNAGDVVFSNAAYDLKMTLSNGEVVTVNNHFDTDYDYGMDQIVFADGVTLGWQGIRDKTVADMKSTGTVQGTEWAENYVHNQGDGSYIITEADWGSNSATDTFTFTDVNAGDVVFSNAAYDLKMTLSNGEVVTVNNHFDTDADYRMDQVSFADGVTLNAQGIRDKSVADMKSTGVVRGTEYTNNYVHSIGDGSYVITDYDPGSNSATDTFTFTDVNASSVVFSQGATNDLLMSLANGETITVNNHFDSDVDYRIERFIFADSSEYSSQQLADEFVFI